MIPFIGMKIAWLYYCKIQNVEFDGKVINQEILIFATRRTHTNQKIKIFWG